MRELSVVCVDLVFKEAAARVHAPNLLNSYKNKYEKNAANLLNTYKNKYEKMPQTC